MRSLIDTGAITREEGGLQYHADSKIEDIPIPENLQALLTARIDQLEDDARRTLQLSSVIGRSFHYGVLKLISDPRIALDRQLSTLQRAELIREAGRVPELEYIFQHDLTREAAYNSIRLRERREFHRRVGEAVEETFDDRLEEQSHLMAHHFFQAGDTQRALKYSAMAGERALSTYANEEALAHFERALTVKNISLTAAEPASDLETAALLFGLGRAQAATLPRHQIQEAVTSLTRALDYYAEAGESDRAVAVAEYPIYPLIGQGIGNDQLIARALALVAPDSPSAGRLLSRYGRLMGIEEGDYHGAQDAFDKALAIARWEEDPILEMRTLADAANVDLIHMRFQDSLEKSMRAIELAGRTNDPHAQVLARYTAVLDNLQLGHLEVARLQASDVLAPAEGLRDRFWHCMALRANQDAAQMAGHFDAARDLSVRALAASPTEPRGLCARTVLEYEIGNFAQGAAFLDRLVEVMRLTPPGPAMENGITATAIAIIARISGTADRLDLAQVAAESVLASTTATPFVTGTAGLGMALLSVKRGDIPTATEQYIALKPRRGIFWLFINVAVDRVLGLLSHTLGNLDQASAHFEDALAFCREAGYRPELAWTCCDYADTLLQRNEPGDHEGAMSLLDESLAISNKLGMRPLMERVLSRREILRA
jgi:tetratricopeptide (TPR) repeat protein